MSGIFGVVSDNLIEKSFYSGLEKWNHGYGDLNCQTYSSDKALIGIKPETLRGHESDLDTYVFEEQGKVGVVDAFIFGGKCETESDERCLFSRVCKKGIDELKTINGDFAGAIWDDTSKELTLFRDHMGVRPLFYYQDSDRVIFSTDIRGITSVEDVDVSVSEDWLYKTNVGAINAYLLADSWFLNWIMGIGIKQKDITGFLAKRRYV